MMPLPCWQRALLLLPPNRITGCVPKIGQNRIEPDGYHPYFFQLKPIKMYQILDQSASNRSGRLGLVALRGRGISFSQVQKSTGIMLCGNCRQNQSSRLVDKNPFFLVVLFVSSDWDSHIWSTHAHAFFCFLGKLSTQTYTRTCLL